MHSILFGHATNAKQTQEQEFNGIEGKSIVIKTFAFILCKTSIILNEFFWTLFYKFMWAVP